MNNNFLTSNTKLYTIGCVLYEKEHILPIDGFYIIGKCGIAFVAKKQEELYNIENKVIVFTTSEDAEKYSQFLARLYRPEFRSQLRNDKHLRMGRFYVKKLSKSFLDQVNIIERRNLNFSEKEKKFFKGNTSNCSIVRFKLKN